MKKKWTVLGTLAAVGLFGVSQASAEENVIPTIDSSLESNDPDTAHHGSSTSSAWNNGRGNLWRVLEQYDLSGYAGSTITEASYTFTVKDITEWNAIVNLHPVTVPWDEDDDTVTWNNWLTNNWDSNTVLGTIGPLDPLTLDGDIITVSIDPSVVQDWIDNPGTNYGWMMKLHPDDEEVEDNNGWEWWSKDGAGSPSTLNFDGDIVIAPTVLLGDANNDGQVTGADLIAVQQNFGNVGPPNDGTLLGDANDDGQVTGADLISVQQNFGNVLGASAVPEPATWTALGLVGVVLMAKRRRS